MQNHNKKILIQEYTRLNHRIHHHKKKIKIKKLKIRKDLQYKNINNNNNKDGIYKSIKRKTT